MPFKEERCNYETIKSLVLDAYFDFCRDSGVVDRWPREQILGRIDYEYENVFERPLEKLMLAVVQLVLQGGWHLEAELQLRKNIAKSIAQYDLEKLLTGISDEEAEMFRHDLRILKLI